MRHTILIADDEEPVHRLLTRSVGERPYDVLDAFDGQDALSQASARKPDLILLDMYMPKKSGWEVLRELRRDVHTRLIPVIIVSGRLEQSEKVGGLELGADDYVTKPFALDELWARVSSLLRRSQLNLPVAPLTLLPGRLAVEQDVERRIAEKQTFAFLCAGVDRFRAYNEAYGFAKGDRLIRETSEIIMESVRLAGADEGFAGHIGGDTFAVVTWPRHAAHLAYALVGLFDRRAPAFYNAADRKRGALELRDAEGLPQRVAISTLSVGIVTSEHRRLESYKEALTAAMEIRQTLKAATGRSMSRFAFDQRQDF